MACGPAGRMAREDSDQVDRALVRAGLRVVPQAVRRALPGSVVAVEVLAEAVVAAGLAVPAVVVLADVGAVGQVSEIGQDGEAIRMLPGVRVLSSAIAATVVNRPFAGCFPCRFAIQPWMPGHSH